MNEIMAASEKKSKYGLASYIYFFAAFAIAWALFTCWVSAEVWIAGQNGGNSIPYVAIQNIILASVKAFSPYPWWYLRGQVGFDIDMAGMYLCGLFWVFILLALFWQVNRIVIRPRRSAGIRS
jgi:hypothetical protein